MGIGALSIPIGSDLPIEAATNTTRLESRSPDPRGPFCNIPGYKSTLQTKIRDDIQQLHNMFGQSCTAPAGPGGCARVACTNGGAVWMCNDNITPSEAPCSMLGDYAQAILDSCGTRDGANHKVVQGQLFDVGSGPHGSGGWGNVVVGLDSSC
ncbi:hypothetical protein PG993_006337 [Apiospora rasikravindrae]|uniref:Uncharacterized protein n=1 Tax=Apiospora rasikravindrae TaxID=990691 RepID=A0ABR1T5G0_9PEZI